MVILRFHSIAGGLLLVLPLLDAAGPVPPTPETGELLAALSNAAATFSRTVPSLRATERLVQHGRTGEMEFSGRGRNNELRGVSLTLPEEFQSHEIVSAYSFGSRAGGGGFHEIRRVLTLDGKKPEPGEVRHAMTMGLTRAEDGAKKEILEELEQSRLVGAAADFGPMLLLFTESGQRNYRFKAAGADKVGKEPAWILGYQQASGPGAVAEFRDRGEILHAARGRIWFRQSDLLPFRITFEADEMVAPKFLLRNEADITYQPTPFGLAPQLILHRQFLNRDLLVENRFSYDAYTVRGIIP